MNSGKPFIITVLLASWLISLAFISSACAAKLDDRALFADAAQYLQRTITKNPTKLGKVSQKCNIKSELDVKKFIHSLPNIGLDELSAALFYLERNNYYFCVKEIEYELNVLLTQLDKLIETAKERKIIINQGARRIVESAQDLLTTTSIELVLLRVQYKSLPENVRNKLESIKAFKNKSFNVFKVIEDLRLHNFGKRL